MTQRLSVSNGNPVVTINATTGNETYLLPGNYAPGRTVTIRREDSSGNTVTVALVSGQTLDGVTDATATIPANSTATFEPLQVGAWESYGLATGGGGSGTPNDGSVTPAKLSSGLATTIAGKLDTTTADRLYGGPNSSTFNLKPAQLFRTRAKLAAARAGSGVCKLTAIGHSKVAGTGAAPGLTDWPNQLKGMLATSGFPSLGTGFVPCNRNSLSLTGLVDARWAFGAGWALFSSASSLASNSTTTNAAVFTSDVVGTKVEVFYHDSAGRSFTVTIDGGSPVTVTPAGAGTSVGVYSVTGLSSATHSVSIARVSGTVLIFGVDVYNTGGGIRLYNGGLGSQTSTMLADANYYATAKIAGSTASWNSDCTFIECITNDAFAAVPVATVMANLQTAINNVKANSQDVVLIAEGPISGLDTTAYVAALYQLAVTNDLPLIDLSKRWTSYPLANSYGMMSDGTHENATGYAEKARAIFNALGI
jgi:hypothetical protein